MPTLSTAVKLAALPALLGGSTAMIAESGGFEDWSTWSGGGAFVLQSASSLKCAKYTEHRHRCSHTTQVPEPASLPILVTGLLIIVLLRKGRKEGFLF